MTPTFTRPAIALALVLALAGCGGKASFPVTGVVANLNYGGLVLTTNGMDLAVAPPAGAPSTTSTSTSFSFPNTLAYGDVFDVSVKSSAAHQDCVVLSGGKDTAGRTAAISVFVGCTPKTAALGGTISGLTATGLLLTNGSAGGTYEAAAGATGFFLSPVAFGVSYGVTVVTQPTGQFCTVSANGVGVMTDDPISNIAVTCK